MDLLFGLPAHPLLVHATLVLVPVCLVLALVWALRPKVRRRLSPWLVVVAVLTAVMAVVTASAGEALALRVPESPLIQTHYELGEQLRLLAIVLAGVTIVAVLVERLGRRLLTGVLAAVLVATAGAATVWDVRAGHAGAKATWQGTAQSEPRPDDGD